MHMLDKTKKPKLTSRVFNYFEDTSLARMINFLNEAVVVVNPAGVIEMANPNAASLLGNERSALLGHNLLECIVDDTGRQQTYMLEKLESARYHPINASPFEVDLAVNKESQRRVSVEMTISTLPEELSSSNSLFLCILRDLTLHKAEYSLLTKKANTDFLTGLANRHRFSEYLSAEWRNARHSNNPLSIIFIDIDHFKAFNDQYGHIAGDSCLKRIGKAISLSLPNRNTLAARYGGEEFALILPNCSAQTAQLLAIRIKRHISQLSTRQFSLTHDAQLTVSMGVATHVDDRYETKEALLNAADTLLYQAKSQGRNQICFL